MKKLLPLLLAIFVTNFLLAQTGNHATAFDNFQKNYNLEKFDEIFNSFSPEMQQAFPFENTKQFLSSYMTQFGKIATKEFIEYERGTFAVYKTKFEKGILAVNISVDRQYKINGFSIKPYAEPNKTVKKTVNALNSYPNEIAESIFSNSKEFPNNTQLSIAIINNGKTNYYGMIKKNDTIKPIENYGSVFEIGSITKVFTSSVLASLVTKNKIRLTDYINSYYPFIFKDGIKINFESLANHTSGLPRLPENFDLSNNKNPYENYGKKALDEYLGNLLKLQREPLKSYSYSNLGAGLLSYTLGLSQKTSFQNLLQKNIFNKYQMKNSFTNSQNLGNKLVSGLNENGIITPNWNFDVLFGGGGILSTTEDLAKFATAQFNPKNKELTLSRKSTFVVNDKMKIGMGWHILKAEGEEDLFWHNGGTGGYSSSMTVNIERKTAVIILSNVSTFNPNTRNIDKLCFELIKQTKKD